MRLSTSKGAEILQIAPDLYFSMERYRYDGSLKRITAFAPDPVEPERSVDATAFDSLQIGQNVTS